MMLIDNREPSWVKNQNWNFPTKVQRLAVGDFLIKGGIVIERKSINDFVSSMQQRMWEQIVDIEENLEDDDNDYTVGAIVIHGKVPDLNSYNMEPRKIQAIYGAISRIIISYGIPVIWVREQSQFIKLITKLHDKGGTESQRKKPHLTKRRFRDDRINLITGIKGISRSRAGDLLADSDSGFATVEEIATASTDRLQDVSGIGPKTAQSIYDAFHDSE